VALSRNGDLDFNKFPFAKSGDSFVVRYVTSQRQLGTKLRSFKAISGSYPVFTEYDPYEETNILEADFLRASMTHDDDLGPVVTVVGAP
jgi:hypothetical protein